MWGTIASLALSGAGAVASAIGSSKANKLRQQELDKQRQRANAFYDTELFQDPTQRSDNQAYLKLLDEKMKKANEIYSAKNKITGGTREQSLAQQENMTNAYADVLTNMASTTSQRRDALLQQKRKAEEEAKAEEPPPDPGRPAADAAPKTEGEAPADPAQVKTEGDAKAEPTAEPKPEDSGKPEDKA